MALTWSVKEIANHEEVTTWIPDHDDVNGRYKAGDRLWNPLTESLVWAAISTGIGRITEANAGEVYARLQLCENLHGAMRVGPDGPVFFTMDEITSHIGLSTNVSYKDETRASFLKRQVSGPRGYLDEVKRRYERHVEKAKAQA